MSIDFGSLVYQAADDQDMESIEDSIKELEERRSALRSELLKVEDALEEQRKLIKKPLQKAIGAAKLLGMDVPEDYVELIRGKRNISARGPYRWEVEGLKSLESSVSRAMWRYSKGSGGSVGNQGCLASGEFWDLFAEQHGKGESDLAADESYQVELPNGRIVRFRMVKRDEK